ncbi:MAG: TetR/AcrR family transcriptional regulator [Chloroflexota bacterium]
MENKSPQSTYHHGDLRNALIDAGLAILQEEGNEALTLRSVARRANVSHAAPYRHFADKHELLSAIATQGFEMLDKAMEAVIGDHPDDAKRRLIEIGVNYVRFGTEYPAHIALMFSNLLSQGQSEELSAAASHTYESLVQAVEDAQAAGEIGPGDSNELANSHWALVHGLTMLIKEGMLVHNQSARLSEVVRTAIGHLIDGTAAT